MNAHPFSREGQARVRSSTRAAWTTAPVWSRLARQVGPAWSARPVFFHRRAVAAQNTRVHHDLGYTVPSTIGGTAHVAVSRYSNSYHRGLRFDKLDRGRVC